MTIHKYHSGKFCPITGKNYRSDCVALENLDFCKVIDGYKETTELIEMVLEKL